MCDAFSQQQGTVDREQKQVAVAAFDEGEDRLEEHGWRSVAWAQMRHSGVAVRVMQR